MSTKLRQFAASTWSGTGGAEDVRFAKLLANDRDRSVRAAFAARLGYGQFWTETEVADDVFAVAENLLGDLDEQVRDSACVSVARFAERSNEKCVSLLLERMATDRSNKVRLTCLDHLQRIGVHGQKALDIVKKEVPKLHGTPGFAELCSDITARAGENDAVVAVLLEVLPQHG